MQSFASPLNFSFTEEFSGKFGLRKDLEHFPDFNKIGDDNQLTICFFLKPLIQNSAPRGKSNTKSAMPDWSHNE